MDIKSVFGKMLQGVQDIDWGKAIPAAALTYVGATVPGVAQGYNQQFAMKQAMEQKRKEDLMNLLSKFDVTKTGTPGSIDVNSIIGEGTLPTGSALKRPSPMEQMMQDPTIGPIIMKAMGGTHGIYFKDPKGNWFEAETTQEVKDFIKKGYTPSLEKPEGYE